MTSYEQLARKAYQAFQKEFGKLTEKTPLDWDVLPDAMKASWLAAAKQLWAEFALIR